MSTQGSPEGGGPAGGWEGTSRILRPGLGAPGLSSLDVSSRITSDGGSAHYLTGC